MVVLLLEFPLTFITPFFGFCIRRFYLSVYVSLADLFQQLYFCDCKYALFKFKYRLTQFSIIVTHSRTGVNRAKANSTVRWSPTWNWSNYSKTLIYIPYKTLPDSEVLLRFSYLSQLPRKSVSSVSISVIHMWLISFEENSGDQNCHHFNDSKMNNVPNIPYEHYKPQIFFLCVCTSIQELNMFP